jgi:hypothetical protein
MIVVRWLSLVVGIDAPVTLTASPKRSTMSWISVASTCGSASLGLT